MMYFHAIDAISRDARRERLREPDRAAKVQAGKAARLDKKGKRQSKPGGTRH